MRPTFAAILASCALLAAGCGPPPVHPAAFPDPDVTCPAGLLSWNLEILDQRVTPEASEKMIASVRGGVEKSFPRCRWSTEAADAPTITITVHRLAVVVWDRYQNAAAEWTVTAVNAGGRTITEFEANEEDTRPAYSGADEDALNEAFRRALQRTVRGLSAMPRIGSARPLEGTQDAAGLRLALSREPAVNR